MIDSLICWALVLLLFAVNGEQSDAKTEGHREEN